MGKIIVVCLAMFTASVSAQDEEASREPSSLTIPSSSAKRTYPGGADEDDLKVLASLPEAALRTDARGIQKEVYKALYNQELKDESHAPVEE